MSHFIPCPKKTNQNFGSASGVTSQESALRSRVKLSKQCPEGHTWRHQPAALHQDFTSRSQPHPPLKLSRVKELKANRGEVMLRPADHALEDLQWSHPPFKPKCISRSACVGGIACAHCKGRGSPQRHTSPLANVAGHSQRASRHRGSPSRCLSALLRRNGRHTSARPSFISGGPPDSAGGSSAA